MSAPAPTTSAGLAAPGDQLREFGDRLTLDSRAERTTLRGAAQLLICRSASASQSSIGTITSAGPLAVTAS